MHIVLFLLAAFAVFYLFGSPKPTSATASALFVAGRRVVKFCVIILVVLGVAGAFISYNEHQKQTEYAVREKASNDKWSQYEVKAAPRTPARRATP